MQTTSGASLNHEGDATDAQRSAAEGPHGSPRQRRVGVLILVALAALTLDVVSKTIVVARLEHRTPIELLGGLLTLRGTRNSGAAFSIGAGYTIVFTVIATGVVVALLRTAPKLRSLPWAISLGLLLGGAMGNLVDRVLRAPAPLQGHVVDWIEFPHWPVFNLADSAIVCGGVLAVLLAARGLQLDGTRAVSEKAAEREDRGRGGADPAEPQPAENAENGQSRRVSAPAEGAADQSEPAPDERLEPQPADQEGADDGEPGDRFARPADAGARRGDEETGGPPPGAEGTR